MCYTLHTHREEIDAVVRACEQAKALGAAQGDRVTLSLIAADPVSYTHLWGRFYEEGGVVIADRYTTSNAVRQCSKLPPEQWEEFLHWLRCV